MMEGAESNVRGGVEQWGEMVQWGRWDGLGMEGNETKMLEKIKCIEPHILVHSVRDST